MTDYSETQQPPRTNADLTAANAALLAENQRMAEILAAMQNNGDRKVDSKRTNADQHEEHQSESNAKTGETTLKIERRRANPREDIIKEILHNKVIRPPVKAGTYQDQKYVDKSKHCAFHQKFGHTTDECMAAKDLLERLSRQGLLDKYVSSRSRKESSEDLHKPRFTSEHRERGTWRMTSIARKRSYRTMMTMERSHQSLPTPTSTAHISFSKDDYKSQAPNLDNPVVISVHMGELTVKKVLLDPGSSADILFYSTFKKMQLSDKALQPSGGELAGFSGERVPIAGYVWLRTTLGEPPNSKTLDIQFLVVDCVSPYNIILGRPSLNSFGAIVSTIHLCVKFSLQDNTIATVHSDHKEARQCYNASLKKITQGKYRGSTPYTTRKAFQASPRWIPGTTTAIPPQQTKCKR
ncbi:uncharacterized protein LOC107633865 [Arachis ipaensis]|uniref:uncharacterized protein LOC107633865 n=1 Tax=Arachis ipaensis TaxID=130454 RepID=UPI0007AF3254|nr:uncharacterized protein LOC107633865 [Arachis ipaensis]